MEMNEETLKKVAKLARIGLEEKDIPPMREALSHIMTWVQQLDAVDTRSVAPLTGVILDRAPFREDQVQEGGNPEEILGNAPVSQLNMFVVPKVVE